jgi:hypothetical protein
LRLRRFGLFQLSSRFSYADAEHKASRDCT